MFQYSLLTHPQSVFPSKIILLYILITFDGDRKTQDSEMNDSKHSPNLTCS